METTADLYQPYAESDKLGLALALLRGTQLSLSEIAEWTQLRAAELVRLADQHGLSLEGRLPRREEDDDGPPARALWLLRTSTLSLTQIAALTGVTPRMLISWAAQQAEDKRVHARADVEDLLRHTSLPLDRVVARTGVSRYQVRRWARAAGISLSRRRSQQQRPTLRARDARILEMALSNDVPQAELARYFGMGKSSISRLLRDHGYERPVPEIGTKNSALPLHLM